ncbi:hypothetical protein SAY87_025154 [Trapa incisa]|uniref:Uncharacterized protein n=2 Tax=Trapa TaxID=22665 RepID=A0AAN7LN04_TRANT|nr:hypothetical protein SAY87_025154 [Trapa incisa]KAK4788850.1 hypothetical protein SAY86_020169 [Trapa natans]
MQKISATKEAAADMPNASEKLDLPDQSPTGSKMSGSNINDRVSDYITRTKLKMRTMSMAMTGGGKAKKAAKEPPAKPDPFADYIHRTKKKFWSTTLSIRGK